MLKKNCTLEYEQKGDELIVFINGEIDHYSAVWIRADIDAKIAEVRPRVTSLMLSGIDFMDSSGIGLIMGRYGRMQKIGGVLKLINPSARVERICRLAGLERIVTIETLESTDFSETVETVKTVKNGGNKNEGQ